MEWQPEIEELNHRRQLAAQMGGKENIDKHHSRGKLTVRQRISMLTDPGSFREIGGLAGNAAYQGEKLVSFTPANTVIGLCRMNGRRVVLSGGDFTVRGGAADAAVADKGGFAQKVALDWLN